MTEREFSIARAGMLYALLAVAEEVLGKSHDISKALYEDLRLHKRLKPLDDPPRWLTDRFAAACDDLTVWERVDRDRLRAQFFGRSEWFQTSS